MPYTEADYGVVSALLAPTPERVATAKAWLVEQRLDVGSSIYPEGACQEFATSQGAPLPQGVDPRFAEAQDVLIPHWQWINAARQAIYDLDRAGLIVPTSSGYNERESPPLLTAPSPTIPLGQVGQQVQPTPFPTTPLFREYVPAMLEEAARQHRLELYDADLFLRRSQLEAFGERAQRCVVEALASYRNDLFLAAANMMGAASEAVWHELAEAMREAGLARQPLNEELAKAAPSVARVQQHVGDDLRNLGREEFANQFGIQWGALDAALEIARVWRDVRNLGMHPGNELDVGQFAQTSVATQFMGATTYFGNLAAIRRALRPDD